jgi:hypothetical protein
MEIYRVVYNSLERLKIYSKRKFLDRLPLAASEPATVRWTMKQDIELKLKYKRRKSHAEKVFSGN